MTTPSARITLRSKRARALFATGLAMTLWTAHGTARAQSESIREPIRIGAVSTLTGPATLPESAAAAKAVFDRFNANGGLRGRKIEFFSVDDKLDPNAAAQAARRLVDEHEVLALAGSAGMRAADARAGASPRLAPAPLDDRRAFAWPCAGHRRPADGTHRRVRAPGRRGAARRTVRRPGPSSRQPRTRVAPRPAGLARRRRCTSARPRSAHGSVLRSAPTRAVRRFPITLKGHRSWNKRTTTTPMRASTPPSMRIGPTAR